jgi:hypothetical protein
MRFYYVVRLCDPITDGRWFSVKDLKLIKEMDMLHPDTVFIEGRDRIRHVRRERGPRRIRKTRAVGGENGNQTK